MMYIGFLRFICVLAVLLMIYLLVTKNAKSARLLCCYLLTAALYCFGYAGELANSHSVMAMVGWIRLEVIGMMLAPVLLHMLVQRFTGFLQNRRTLISILMFVVPVFCIIAMLLWQPEGAVTLYYTGYQLETSVLGTLITMSHGWAFYVGMSYISVLLISGLVMMGVDVARSTQYRRRSSMLIILAIVLNAAFAVSYAAGFVALDLVSLGLALAGFLLSMIFTVDKSDVLSALAVSMTNSLPAALLLLDPALVVMDANPAACAMLQIESSMLNHLSAPDILIGWPDVSIEPEKEHFEEFTLYQLNGETHHYTLHRSPLFDNDHVSTGQILLVQDVTSQRDIETKLDHAVQHDLLTGLPNRTHMMEQLRQCVAAQPAHISVIHINADHFQSINHTMGTRVGDMVIYELSLRLKMMLQADELVCRFGGDEFLLALYCDEDELEVRLQNLTNAIKAPFRLSPASVNMTVSIGVACYPEDGQDADALVSNATIAQTQAKLDGRNRYCRYAEELSQTAHDRWAIAADLKTALALGQLSMHYQPIVQCEDGRTQVIATEALLRWQHPERGWIPPDMFVPIMEEYHLTEEIGHWIFDEACGQLRKWLDQGVGDLKMCINLSVQQLYEEHLTSMLAATLARHKLVPQMVELEITESTTISSHPQVLANIRMLREMGLILAMDDFGMGHASLTYLCNYDINTVKLDRSLSLGVMDDPRCAAMVRAIMLMCKSMDLQLIVEFIETPDHLERLRQLDCIMFQGFYFARPQSPDLAFANILRSNEGRLEDLEGQKPSVTLHIG